MKKTKLLTLTISIFLIYTKILIAGPILNIADMVAELERLIGTESAMEIDKLLQRTPGRLLEFRELQALLTSLSREASRAKSSEVTELAKHSQRRIIIRLMHELEGTLYVPTPNLDRFSVNVAKISTENLARNGIDLSRKTTDLMEFDRMYRTLHEVLDTFEVVKVRSLGSIDPKLEEYLEGLSRSVSIHRIVAESLADLLVIADKAFGNMGLHSAEARAFYARFFENLSVIFREVVNAKLLLENHIGELTRFMEVDSLNFDSGLSTFVEKYTMGFLPSRFQRIHRLAYDVTSIRQEYFVFLGPLLKNGKIGDAEEMLSLIWARESFRIINESVSQLKSASKTADLRKVASEIADVLDARSSVINMRLSEARLNIFLQSWNGNVLKLKGEMQKRTRMTKPIPATFYTSSNAVDLPNFINSELSAATTAGRNLASAISELTSDVDYAILPLLGNSALSKVVAENTLKKLGLALSILNGAIGEISNTHAEVDAIISAESTVRLSDGLKYVISSRDLRATLRDFLNLRKKIVDELLMVQDRVIKSGSRNPFNTACVAVFK